MSESPTNQPPLSGPYLPPSAGSATGRDYNQPRQQYGSMPSMRPTVNTPAQEASSPTPDPARPQIQRPKRRLASAIAVIGVAIAVVAALLSGWGTRNDPPPGGGSSSPSASSTKPADRTPLPGTQATIVVSPIDGAEAWWEILDVRWDSTGVSLDVRLTGEKGTLGYSFFALDNTNTTSHDPDFTWPGALPPGAVSAPNSIRGIVRFEKNRGDTTVIIATPNGRQITALVVSG